MLCTPLHSKSVWLAPGMCNNGEFFIIILSLRFFAGLGRTGTTSLRHALDLLGLGPCYSMRDTIKLNHSRLWLNISDAVSSGASDVELKLLFDQVFVSKQGRYCSSADHPGAVFFEQLMRLYPEAKVVLTVRDSADAWYKSAQVRLHTAVGSHCQ